MVTAARTARDFNALALFRFISKQAF